jgi:hypothetical protein
MQTLSPHPHSLQSIGLGDFPLQGQVERLLALDSRPPAWQATGLDRSAYLDVIEVILRAAQGWQDQHGAIIDPVYGKEWGQTTSRFASSGAILLAHGRMPELLPGVARAMDWVCARLPRGQMDAPDFQTREIMTAFLCLKQLVSPSDLARWADGIRAIEPERVYKVVSPDGKDIERLHNWNLYACAGEVMRQANGLGPEQPGMCWGQDFFHKYVPVQLRHHITAFGMYRDPNDPLTYDIQSRLQLAIALTYGYNGEWQATTSEVLRRGALTSLLFVTPDGLVPFGGRSDQFHFRETAVAVLCELEALRYRESNPALAGAFKRQAHISTRATRRWLVEMQPHRHLKNGFPPLANWGTDRYGFYSVYSLLTSSLLGLAALFADDSIPEAPCPAEIGGFTLQLMPAFHKVFANCQQTFLTIDTAADFHHNATGLGSLQCAGCPTELALAMPFTPSPDYNLEPAYLPIEPLAIGPMWQRNGHWQSLSALSAGLESQLEMLVDQPDRQEFQLTYQAGDTTVLEQYRLAAGRLVLRARVDGAEAIRMRVPLLSSDGDEQARLHFSQATVQVTYRGSTYTVHYPPGALATLDLAPVGNRNGIYRLLVIEVTGPEIEVTLEMVSRCCGVS